MTAQKLLIIDDSPDIHELVTIWLADQSLEFFSSSTGIQGVEEAARILPDLILLDVDLPDLDGFEVCRRLKADDRIGTIPVVFLTGASSSEEKLRGLELGAIDYIVKPFDPAELRARVRAALHTKRLMDLLAQKAAVLQESEERFRILAENSSDVISRHTPQGAFLYASPACKAILGYAPEQIAGRSLLDFAHPEEASTIAAVWPFNEPSEETKTLSYRFRRGDGQYVWLESTCRKTVDPATGAVREINAATRDVTLRKQMEYREQLRVEVLEKIAEGDCLSDLFHQLLVATEQQEPEAVAAIMLSDGQTCYGERQFSVPIDPQIERRARELMLAFSSRAALGSERVVVCDLQTDPMWAEIRPVLGNAGIVSCWFTPILTGHRESCGALAIYQRDDRSPGSSTIEFMKLASELIGMAIEHRQLTDQLTFQALHDILTGLPNRAMFSDRLEQALAHASRNHRPGAVVVVDVDRFKHVNDTYGHHAGDEMLCQVAHRLSMRLRKSDTLARMGGDEFAIILAELARPDDAEYVSKMLLQAFATPMSLCGREVFVSVSIGSAVFPQDGSDSSTLLQNADLALYSAKDSGRNTLRPFTPDMRDGAAERLELESALRLAVTNQELRLFYQPKVNSVGHIVGLEALLRWQHPRLGMILPARFIPLAEDSGLILPIGEWVLQEAARQTREWIAQGITSLPIAVNVSTLQFSQPDFIDTVWRVVQSGGLPEKWLEIELTESLLMRNMHDAAERLTELKKLGVGVAIDDFGTGYSSLAYLQRLPIETLKIDQSFIAAIDSPQESSNGRTIIKSIISMAKSLGLRVIAEGVETRHQQEVLTELGCDLMQGYLFGPPVSAAAIKPCLPVRAGNAASCLAISA